MLRIRFTLPMLFLSAVSLSVQAGPTTLRFVEPEKKSPYRGAQNVPQIIEAFYAAERDLWGRRTTSLDDISIPAGEREDFQTFNTVLELSRQAFVRIAQHTGLQVLMGVSGSGSQISYSLVLNNKWYEKRVAHFDTALQAAANAQSIVEGYSARVTSDPTEVGTSDLQTQSASLSQVYDSRIQDLSAQKRDLESAWEQIRSRAYGRGKFLYPHMDVGALLPVAYMPTEDWTGLCGVTEKMTVLQSYWETLFSGSFTLFNKPLMAAPTNEINAAATVVVLEGPTSAPASTSSTPLSSPRFGDQPSAVVAADDMNVPATDAPQLDVVDEIPAGAEADSTVAETPSSSSSPAPVEDTVVADGSLVAAQPTLPVDAESEDDESFSDTASTISEGEETPEDAALQQSVAETPATAEPADGEGVAQ